MSLRHELRDSIERIAADHGSRATVRADALGPSQAAEALWQSIVTAGFDRAATPEATGGAGLGWRELLPLVETVGNFALPVPLAETLAAQALAARIGCVLPDGAASIARLTPQGRGWSARSVAWLDRVTAVLGVSADGAVFVLDPLQAQVESGRNPAGEPRGSASWPAGDGSLAAVGRIDPDSVVILGAAVRAAQIAGALRRVLTMTVEYAGTREQFGRPIGRFQAVQQQLALMAELTVQAGIGAELAFECEGLVPDPLRVASAKQVTSANALQCAAIAHAVHGAIGVTEACDLQLFTRRLKAWAAEWGGASYWATFIGRSLLDGDKTSVWHAVIEASTAQR